MCCLFGLIDYGHKISGAKKSRMLNILAKECEDRGTDATGIAYYDHDQLKIYKRPVAAHKMRFRIPDHVNVVMGHTRMTTQGDAKRNRNNHPFPGVAANRPFALAHNGVLWNDDHLRQILKLPATKIETDSYVAVQLIEQQKALNFTSLKNMAELVEGSFCFTVLDQGNQLYFVKGDNPMCIAHFPGVGLYLYASTREILARALSNIPYMLDKGEEVSISEGEIMKILPNGNREVGARFFNSYYGYHYPRVRGLNLSDQEKEHIEILKTDMAYLGYDPDCVEKLLEEGFSIDEIEEFIYGGEL